MANVSKMLLLFLTLLVSARGNAAPVDRQGSPPATDAAPQSEQDTQDLQKIRRWIGGLDAVQTAKALQLALDVVQRDAKLTEAVLQAASTARFVRDVNGGGHADILRAIAAAARAQISTLPEEQSVRAARQLVDFEGVAGIQTWEAGVSSFSERYAGTELALEVQVDVLMRQRTGARGSLGQTLRLLDDFARSHPGTTAAAKALHQQAFMLGTNAVGSDLEPYGADPAARLMTVMSIVKELESGRYPPCRWVDDAPRFVAEFFTFRQSYAAANVAAVVAALREFALQHMPPSTDPAVSSVVDQLILARLDKVADPETKRTDLGEQLLLELEKDPVRATRARYLRSWIYLGRAAENYESRDQLRDKAKAILAQILDSGDGAFPRAALERLASLHYEDGEDVRARELLLDYLAKYADAPSAPTALLKLGAVYQSQGDMEAALAAYRSAAINYASQPTARILGRAFAARLLESNGQFDDARRQYRLALIGWEADGPPMYKIDELWRRANRVGSVEKTVDRVDRAAAIARVKELDAIVALPGGALLDRGRALIEDGRMREALAPLEEFLRSNPPPEALAEARSLVHRIRLADALALVDLANPSPAPVEALRLLDELSREPYDVVVFAARVARASLLFTLGSSLDAEVRLKAALEEWRVHSNAAVARPVSPLEEDVRRIRDLMFRPKGDGWIDTAFQGRVERPPSRPFVFIDPSIAVTTSDGEKTEIRLVQKFSEAPSVLFLSARDALPLASILDALAGRFSSLAVPLDVPEPRAPAADVPEFWNKFFQADAGHWGSWWFFAGPVPFAIEFLDDQRTKASVQLGMDSSGMTILVEKVRGEWRFVRVVSISMA